VCAAVIAYWRSDYIGASPSQFAKVEALQEVGGAGGGINVAEQDSSQMCIGQERTGQQILFIVFCKSR